MKPGTKIVITSLGRRPKTGEMFVYPYWDSTECPDVYRACIADQHDERCTAVTVEIIEPPKDNLELMA